MKWWREVRANLVYRSFTQVGGTMVPDHTVMNKWALALGPELASKRQTDLPTLH